MDIHPKFATWLASANINLEDGILRKWWAGLDAFVATPQDIVSLVQLANEADTALVESSSFHAMLRKHDAALLPKDKLAVAALAAAKLYIVMEHSSEFHDFAALLSTVRFPIFEKQPAYRADLAMLAEETLTHSCRSRADLNGIVKRLEQGSSVVEDGSETENEDEDEDEEEEKEREYGERFLAMERVLAVTAEESNILWWIFGGRTRDSNQAFADVADEIIPFVAAKELADLTTLLPGHVAVRAFAEKVCRTDRANPPQTVSVTAAIKRLPPSFIAEVSKNWDSNHCLPLCRLTREITGQTSAWGKNHKLRTGELALLFYRECLVRRAWQKVTS